MTQFAMVGMQPQLRALAEDLEGRVQTLLTALKDGRISPQEWREAMRRLLARYHLSALSLGIGVPLLPDGAGAIVTSHLESMQYPRLDDFYQKILMAETFNEAWRYRAHLYSQSIKTSYHEGDVFRQAGQFLPLPAMPAQGTQCLTNCGCSWRIENKGNGRFLAYWVRHKRDSCQTCVEREAQWQPLVIQDGRLMPEGTAVKHLRGQHDQKRHAGGLGQLEDWAKSSLSDTELSAVRRAVSSMSSDERKEFFDDALANVRRYGDPDTLKKHVMDRVTTGQREARAEVGRIYGTPVHKVNRFTGRIEDKDTSLAVGIKGKDRATILMTTAKGGALNTRPHHEEMTRMVGGNIDNYVRFAAISHNGRRVLMVDVAFSAADTTPGALRNIYRALDMLANRGLPVDTPVLIRSAFERDFDEIMTTVKANELRLMVGEAEIYL